MCTKQLNVTIVNTINQLIKVKIMRNKKLSGYHDNRCSQLTTSSILFFAAVKFAELKSRNLSVHGMFMNSSRSQNAETKKKN